MKALVLAAGKGVRLKPLTDNLPKAMVLLKGKPLLAHVLLSLKKAGVKEAIIVVGYLSQKIMNSFGQGFEGMRLGYVIQQQQLGNAHAIALARQLLREDFLLAFTDVIPEAKIWKALAEENADAVIAVRKEKHAERFGVVELKGNRVVSIEEKPAKPKSDFVIVGCYKFSPKIFEAIARIKPSARNEIELTDAMRLLAKQGKAIAVKYAGKTIDIGSLQDLRKAENEK